MCISAFEYLRFGQGLLSGAPLRATIGVQCGIIRKGDLPFFGRLRLQIRGGRPFLPSPPRGESCFPPPPPCRRWRVGSGSRLLRTSCPKCPYGGGHLWSPWPSSWPSSPAPGRAPEPASSSKAGLLGFRAAELDTGSAPPSLSRPVKTDKGSLDILIGGTGEGRTWEYEKLTELVGWVRLYPRSSVVSGHVSLALKSIFQMSSCVVPKNCCKV